MMRQLASTGHTLAFSYAPKGGQNIFKRLFSVRIHHQYYTQDRGLCPDFRISPAPESARLMASLGLVFKDEGIGFSVFVDPTGLTRLINYLRRNARDQSDGSGFWTLLSFLMIPVNPLFVGITALPIDTDPMQVNLFACNSQAHRKKAEIILAKGAYLDTDSLYPTVGANVVLAVPANTCWVVVSGLSGAPVQSNAVAPVASPSATVSLDLGDLPFGYYTIGLQDADGATIVASAYPRTVLYVAARPTSLGLLDMLFTQPRPDMSGVYPIPPLFDLAPDQVPTPDQVGEVEYVVPFDARATYWQYYVVSQTPDSRFTDLSIEGPGATFTRQKKPVVLPGGAIATLFKAGTSLPLRQPSPQRFQLQGSRRSDKAQENDIVVACLPVAPGAPVWPGPTKETGTSEMFVYV
jgi:hypothetical protein